jgi:hypothetical protein
MSRTDEKEYRIIHRKDPKVEFEKWFEKEILSGKSQNRTS